MQNVIHTHALTKNVLVNNQAEFWILKHLKLALLRGKALKKIRSIEFPKFQNVFLFMFYFN